MSLPELPDVFGNYALRGFEEVLAPDPISWLPVTLGWRIVFTLLLVRVCWSIFKRSRQWWHDRYRRAALRKLEQIFIDDLGSAARLQALAQLLKATALYACPRAEVAALSGDSWIGWLNQHTEKPAFSERVAALLTTALYQSPGAVSDSSFVELKSAIAQWIQRHPRSGHD